MYLRRVVAASNFVTKFEHYVTHKFVVTGNVERAPSPYPI